MRKGKSVGKIFGIALVLVMIGSMLGGLLDTVNIVSAQSPIYEFLTYANFGSDNSCYTPGQGVGGYENKLYVATSSRYCYVYEVSVPQGADPDMHPDNPEAVGPMAPRTLTFIESHDILSDMQTAVPGLTSTYQSISEFYIDDNYIYYGPSPGGVHYWAKNNDGTFGEYQGRIVDVELYAQTLAYDDTTNTWYAGAVYGLIDSNSMREIYSFGPEDTAWQFEFDYTGIHPELGDGYGGSHHDGLEFVNGYLWVSDMTSNYIGQWEKTTDGSWEESACFTYENPVDDEVEGMGFGPLGHLWATGWSRIYEIGGRELGVVIKGIDLSIRLDKNEYNPNEMMELSLIVIDKDGNNIYPLTKGDIEVKIDGNDVNIENITAQYPEAVTELDGHTLPVTSGKISHFASDDGHPGVCDPAAWGELLGERCGTDEATKYWYVAMRWDYAQPGGKAWWHNKKVLVTNPVNGKQVVLAAKDWGPAESTGRVIDVSETALDALGSVTDYVVNIEFADQSLSLGLVQTEWLVKVKAPSEVGEHNVWIQVVTDLGSASDEKTFTVKSVVLLVHGFQSWDDYDPEEIWEEMKESLSADGFKVYVSHYANDAVTCLPLQTYAKYLGEEVEKIKQDEGVDKVNIVAHSFGGLVSRWYIEKCSGYENVRKLIMLETPNSGVTEPEIPVIGPLTGKIQDGIIVMVLAGTDPQVKCVVDSIASIAEKVVDHIPFIGEETKMKIKVEIWLAKFSAYIYSNLGRVIEVRDWESVGGILLGMPDVRQDIKEEVQYVNILGALRYAPWATDIFGLEDTVNEYTSDWHCDLPESAEVIEKVKEILHDDPEEQSAKSGKSENEDKKIQCAFSISAKIFPDMEKLYEIPIGSARMADFALLWSGGSLNLTLATPSDTLVDPFYAESDPNITHYDELVIKGYVIEDPEPGIWELNISAIDVPEGGVDYMVMTLLETPIMLSLDLSKCQYEPGEEILIRAELTSDAIPLIAAFVMAEVKRPDNTVESIILYDDGSHNDEAANDGIYANTYTNTSLWGTYDITVAASGAVDDEEFAREAFAMVWVEQYPDLALSESNINLSNNNPQPGEVVTINATIHNVGSADANNASILFYAGGPVGGASIGEGIIDVEAGKAAETSIEWIAVEGVKEICILVSPYNEFLEEDYTNNKACAGLIYPDIWIDILTSEEAPEIEQHTRVIETLADEPCNLTVYIRNSGSETLHNAQILTNVGVAEDVGDIDEGEVKQVPIEFMPTTPGLTALNVTVESDEFEKSLTRTLLVEKFDFTVVIPKTEYELNEPVPINILVTNEVSNIRFIDLKIEINITGSYDQTFDIPLLSLAPLVTKDTTFTWDTTGIDGGMYTITTSLVMADQVLMTDTKLISLGNQPPVANAGPDQTVCVIPPDTTAMVTLDGSGSYDPDGDPLTYNWTWDGNTAYGVNPTVELSPGTTTITLVVNDGKVDSEPDTVNITVLIPAAIDFVPDVLNLNAKGKYVTAYIELPPGYDVSQIDISSIRLNDTVPALGKPTEVGDYDNDGVPDLMVKFNKAAVQDTLTVGEEVGVTITGEVAGIGFEGSDIIRVITTAAPHGLREWSRVPTPSEEGWVLSPGSDIIDYAVADGGEVAYAVVNSTKFYLLKSTDHAATWDDDINDALLDELEDDFYEGVGYVLVRVTCDPEDSEYVAVALEVDGEVHAYTSTDGGATFRDTGEVEDGVSFPDGSYVTDLAVSPEDDDEREIAVVGSNGTIALIFHCTAVGEFSTGWEDARYDGWDNQWSNDFVSMVVTDVKFAPSWTVEKTILVTTVVDEGSDLYSVYLQSGTWGITEGWNEQSIASIPAVPIIEDVHIPVCLATRMGMQNFRGIAGLTLPLDYSARYSDSRYAWVWVNWYYLGEPVSTIFKVKNDDASPVGPMGQIEDGEVWLTNVDYLGYISEGKAIAGVLGTGGYAYDDTDPCLYYPDIFTDCCEGVQIYRNDNIVNMDNCCMPWEEACKPPTGRAAMAAFYASDDPATSKAYAVALWGLEDCDEGAWLVSFDDGDDWNQLSLIDTHIDYLSDVAVSPDCNKTMLVSVNEESSCECDSVWLRAENLLEASEYNGKWMRTWCGQLEGDIEEGWERGLLRLATEETTGDTVYLVDYGTDIVYWNEMETLDCWEDGTATVDEIVDLAVKDRGTIYALDYYGDVAMSDDYALGWHTPVDSKVEYGWTIAVRGDDILVGGCDGDVSHSDDGGETFTELEEIPVVVDYALVTVAFDSYFDANDTIYAAVAGFEGSSPTTGGIYRWVIGESDEWENLNAEDYAYTGLVLNVPSGGKPETSAETGGVLYASYVSGDTTGVARCLTPAEDMCCDGTDWDYLTRGLTSELFKMTPQALKICGCLTADTGSRFFAIDGSEPYDMVDGLTGTVWSFED